MELPKYHLKAEKSLTVFEFVSEGPNGSIPKIVKFSGTNIKGLYNVAFGDKDKITGEVSDKIISNNGDSEKVLATIVATIYAFTEMYPESFVFAVGSNKARTRLYRIGITKYILKIKEDFVLYGLRGESWEPFEHHIDYDAFLIRRK